MTNLLEIGRDRSSLEVLWRQAEQLGAITVFCNKYQLTYRVEIDFCIGRSEIEAKCEYQPTIELALEEAINIAVDLGAARDDAYRRHRL